jgi:glycosyltransferase involved in cell wall biosynthesis
LRYLRPDLILVQSTESESLFKSLGYKTAFLPNGVDITKFRPYDENRKKEIREKMNISTNEFIILHMASLTKERNLSVLAKIQRQGECKVLIIGRENEKFDTNVTDELGSSGCNILIKNFENIEEIYNMADCYVFPTINKKACIEMPLSVLEAMACNLPIITTRFGALPRLFNEGGGIFYIDNEQETTRYIELIRNRKIIIETRKKVLSASWSCVLKKLCEYYDKLLQ